MATPHNNAESGQIANVLLLPGDPLRAKLIADTYLTDIEQFNGVRNMLGYTGIYEGMTLSVMGSGMGIPSMAIYSWELFNDYDVDVIIRIGSAGGIGDGVKLRDLVIAQAACTDSNYCHVLGVPGSFAPIADFALLRHTVEICERLGVPYRVGNLLTTDVFYNTDDAYRAWADAGVLAVEMETAALYTNAARAHKRAIAMTTISDLPLTKEGLSAEDRQNTFTQMMEVALDLAVACCKGL